MELNKGHIAFAVACFVAGGIIGAGLKSCSTPKQPKADPVVIHDTIEVSNPADIEAHSKPKYVIKRDTMWLPRPVSPCDSVDSLCDGRVTDSIPVDIPIMAYEYRDTFQTDTSRIELGIRYEGYKAKIDGIDLNYKFWIEPPKPVVKKQRFTWSLSFGLQGGYGATFGKNGVVEMRPYAGVGGTLGFSINF